MHNLPDTETSAAAPRVDRRLDARDAESIYEAAHNSNLGRSTICKAISPDPRKRGNLPFLPSIKIGHRRIILRATRLAWLKQLEELASAGADTAAAALALFALTLFGTLIDTLFGGAA
jgi:hypothetical protein